MNLTKARYSFAKQSDIAHHLNPDYFMRVCESTPVNKVDFDTYIDERRYRLRPEDLCESEPYHLRMIRNLLDNDHFADDYLVAVESISPVRFRPVLPIIRRCVKVGIALPHLAGERRKHDEYVVTAVDGTVFQPPRLPIHVAAGYFISSVQMQDFETTPSEKISPPLVPAGL